MASNKYDGAGSVPEELLAVLDADPALIDHDNLAKIEKCPIAEIKSRAVELGLTPSVPYDLQRVIIESAPSPADDLLGLLVDGEAWPTPENIEKLPLVEVTAYVEQLNINYHAGFAEIIDLVQRYASSSGHDSKLRTEAGKNYEGSHALVPRSLAGQLSRKSGTIRIAVIDDHPLFREGAVQSLTCMDGIEVVGEGATAADALSVAEELHPDVMLLDISMPGGGIEAAANIAWAYPSVRPVMFTASESERDVASALEAGARGYILKGSSCAEVVEAVRAIVQGASYVAPNLAARLLMGRGKRNEGVAREPVSDLTAREDEILALVSSGMTNKEIANRLRLTERTVKHHMTSIKRKSNVTNRVEAMLMFRRKFDG
jgi:DNA-binding NarL/FixJ family response regulator